MGGCRVCERMSDLSPQELAGAIVGDNVQRYIESRRGRIDAFVDRHFTLAGSVALHRRALGWDLLWPRPICFSRGRRSPSSSWAGRRGGPAWSRWRHGLRAAGSSSRPRSRARSSGWWQPNCSKYRADGGIGALWYGLFPATARSRTARRHDRRRISWRSDVGRLFQSGHRSLTAPDGPASAKARMAFAGLGGGSTRGAGSKSAHARPLCRPPRRYFRPDCPRNAGLPRLDAAGIAHEAPLRYKPQRYGGLFDERRNSP
jgi:hypothetical protein